MILLHVTLHITHMGTLLWVTLLWVTLLKDGDPGGF
jgi:hypothetical protein